MVYTGSKQKFCDDILPFINDYIKKNKIEIVVSPFCGGANIEDKIQCEKIICNDLSPTLIALHKVAQENFDLIPLEGGREYWNRAYKEYKKILKNFSTKYSLDDFQKMVSMPLYEIGAIEWYESFSRGGFIKGYAKSTETRNFYNEARRNHYIQSQTSGYKKLEFIQGDYLNLKIPEDVLVYCDAPYKNSASYQINPKFNFAKYYEWLKKLSKTNPIFISEQEMPQDFEVIWEKKVRRMRGPEHNFKTQERLYFIDERRR